MREAICKALDATLSTLLAVTKALGVKLSIAVRAP
jgi:DNA-binding phage protein